MERNGGSPIRGIERPRPPRGSLSHPSDRVQTGVRVAPAGQPDSPTTPCQDTDRPSEVGTVETPAVDEVAALEEENRELRRMLAMIGAIADSVIARQPGRPPGGNDVSAR